MDTLPIQKEMLAGLPVSAVDVYRLFLEFAEEAGVVSADRAYVIELYRKVIRAGIHSVRIAEQTMPFSEVALASVAARHYRRPSTVADLRSYTNRMIRFADWATAPLRYRTRVQCREMLTGVFGHSPFVFRKAKTILHSVFAYGLRQGWCASNPVDGIESPPVYEETIEILTLTQIRALMRALEARDMREMDAAVRLMLWCGVRPGEVRRLHWHDIDVQEGVVYIDGANSKTGGPRVVPLRGGARVLLHIKPDPDAYIAPRNWNRLWLRLRRRAGLYSWQRDALRHTFASMSLKHFHNLPLLQEEMGHRDASLLRTRYLNMRNLTSAAARHFFQDW